MALGSTAFIESNIYLHICKLLKFHFISQIYYDFIIVTISDVEQQTREARFSEINPLGPHLAHLLQKFVRRGIGVSVYHLM